MIKLIASDLVSPILYETSFGFATEDIEYELFDNKIKVNTMISYDTETHNGNLYSFSNSIIVPIQYKGLNDLKRLLPKPYLISHILELTEKHTYHYQENRLFIDYNFNPYFPLLTDKYIDKYVEFMNNIIKYDFPFSAFIPFKTYLDKNNYLTMKNGKKYLIDRILLDYFNSVNKYIFDTYKF